MGTFIDLRLARRRLVLGLSQAESRAIHASWDKMLHASVFFIIWWLGRWSLRVSWVWVSLWVILGGDDLFAGHGAGGLTCQCDGGG